MNQLLWPGVAMVSVALSAVLASETGFRHKAGSETWTEPAGSFGSTAVDVLTSPDYYGVQALTLRQFDRRTCALQIEEASLNVRATGLLDTVKICEPKVTEVWRRADVGSGQFVTSIAVCTGKDKNFRTPIDGVQLGSATLNANGKLTLVMQPIEFEFVPCERWSMRRACPPGSIATGFRIYMDHPDEGAIGLALRCHEIETFSRPSE